MPVTPPAAHWAEALEARLSPALLARLRQVQAQAAVTGLAAYLAGGPVRDLLLGRAPTDLDLVIIPPAEGHAAAPRLAHALCRAHGGELTVHEPFGTATWRDPAGLALDFATARTETYSFPGALPTVAFTGRIETDLRRRDFTLNALALRLDGAHFGELVDPYGGQADLAAGLVRVLHPASFQDDPTRIFRAVRYAGRLGFRLADDSAALIPAALPALAALSGERVRHELALIFREDEASASLARLEALGALAAVHPSLRWDETAADDSDVIRTLPRPAWQWTGPLDLDSLYLALLLRGAPTTAVPAGLQRLDVTRAVLDAVTGALGLTLAGERPSALVAQLDRLTPNAVVAAFTARPEYRDRLDAYLSRWRHMRANITGDDLLAWGLQPGPEFKRILARLRAARLDGELDNDAGERALARALAGLE